MTENASVPKEKILCSLLFLLDIAPLASWSERSVHQFIFALLVIDRHTNNDVVIVLPILLV